MKIQSAKASQLGDLETFYHIAGYGGLAAPEDPVVYVTEEGRTIGVDRLSKEEGVFVLRGMRILKEYCDRGVGKAILDSLVREGSSLILSTLM